jgi:membrane protein DedA with SNARE-associated domain
MVLLAAGILDELLTNFGYLAVFAVVGSESLGIPLPGETMLITAAIYAGATHKLSIALVIGSATAGAILGDNLGYVAGYKGGLPLLRRYGRYVRLDERRLKLARYLFYRYGGRVVFFGRFISILRTYAASFAGASQMPWRRFFLFNAAGGIIWSLAYGLAAYYGHERLQEPEYAARRRARRRGRGGGRRGDSVLPRPRRAPGRPSRGGLPRHRLGGLPAVQGPEEG